MRQTSNNKFSNLSHLYICFSEKKKAIDTENVVCSIFPICLRCFIGVAKPGQPGSQPRTYFRKRRGIDHFGQLEKMQTQMVRQNNLRQFVRTDTERLMNPVRLTFVQTAKLRGIVKIGQKNTVPSGKKRVGEKKGRE